ncbi:AAA family ATPase [Actinoplanes bogorensis]|uniref:AAA family ATPase n=1 Tax=Paractinoplanes bogorensis TaxID=1610840 RepID=A0ABS5YSL7_9ACTN|nr:AAA family ATPase [Actinoplanes bogorensis]MBU2666437.1 AAA family ATPase [Actinoplanes bogorensis]
MLPAGEPVLSPAPDPELFAGLTAAGPDGAALDGAGADGGERPAGPPEDPLLAEMTRAGAGEGPDVAATIRAEQDELIRTTPESVLIIQGGPGTGKTDTALRRVAWLLTETALGVDAEVLVVGPSAAFAQRTRALLDAWGCAGVEHSSVDGLLPKAATGRPESPHVTRLKGEARMAALLGRAIEKRRERQGRVPALIVVRGKVVTLDPAMIQRVITTAKASEATPGDRRRLLRAALVAGTEDPRLILEAADQLADRLWPEFDAATFLAELFGSRALLAEAAGGEFTDRETNALYRGDAEDPPFSDADLPLLDEAEHLSGQEPRTYAHVVVDEAPDLSPMQLRAISRRSSNGSLTVVGDMAQSTGPWARDDWHDVLAHLPSAMPHVHRELRFGYRVPRQIFELAAELLPSAAPSVQPPTTVRDGPADPMVAPVEPAERAAVVVAAAADHAADGRSVAIVCPPRCRDEIETLLRAEELPWRSAPGDERSPAITLLGPHEAKGLEFDAAIVVEPGFIVDDDPRGHRLLYIALTRATGFLHLVGAPEDLPFVPSGPAFEPDDVTPLATPADIAVSADIVAPVDIVAPTDIVAPAVGEPPSPLPPAPPVTLDPEVQERIDLVAQALAETLLSNLTPELWPIALDRLIELISPDS